MDSREFSRELEIPLSNSVKYKKFVEDLSRAVESTAIFEAMMRNLSLPAHPKIDFELRSTICRVHLHPVISR